ncbi:MAG: hypothetical protein WAV95_15800 [Azonexus sp.]
MLYHEKISGAPATGDDDIDGPEWNKDHVFGAGSIIPLWVGRFGYSLSFGGTGTFFNDAAVVDGAFREGAGSYIMPIDASSIKLRDGCAFAVQVTCLWDAFSLPPADIVSAGGGLLDDPTSLADIAVQIWFDNGAGLADPSAGCHAAVFVNLIVFVP